MNNIMIISALLLVGFHCLDLQTRRALANSLEVGRN